MFYLPNSPQKLVGKKSLMCGVQADALADAKHSCLFLALFSCETWTLTAEMERQMRTVDMRGFRRLLGISHKNHITSEEVQKQDSESHWTLRRTLVHCKQTQNEVVWACHKSFETFQDSPPGRCMGREKGRQTKKTMGR